MTEANFKGGWHAFIAVASGTTCAYNVMRFMVTRKPRNAVNAVLHAGLTWWELLQAKHHWMEKA